jgi:hypothetical protein
LDAIINAVTGTPTHPGAPRAVRGAGVTTRTDAAITRLERTTGQQEDQARGR